MFRPGGDLTESSALIAVDKRCPTAAKILLLLLFATQLAPVTSFAESVTQPGNAAARLDFRIVIPAVIAVVPAVQPDRIIIEEQHIAMGYIDLDAATSVKLTNNTRAGYQLTASYDTSLLAKVDVHVDGQQLRAQNGFGSMLVKSGLAINRLVPFSYRLHLVPGVSAGTYRWPIVLAFSLGAI